MSTRASDDQIRNAGRMRARECAPMSGTNAERIVGPLTIAKAELDKQDSGSEETSAA
jgi:hypothetical protein